MDTLAPSRLLRTGLVIDALGSGPLGLLHAVGGAAVAERTGLSQDLLFGTGAFMLAYVVLLVVLATRPRLPVALVRVIALGNVAWAAAAIAVGVEAGAALTGYGAALIAVHAVGVLLFAALQYRGMQQSVVSGGAARAVATA